MRGLLSDLPLLGLLELVHESRQTGVLSVGGELPYTVTFSQGEVVAGGVLDWLGLEALQTCPLSPQGGDFEFESRSIAGRPLQAYGPLLSEWARVSDEWARVSRTVGSPSRVFRGELPLFSEGEGRSVRAAARRSNRPLIDVAAEVAQATQAGRLEATDDYAWFALVLKPSPAHGKHPISAFLDGQRNLGEIARRSGLGVGEVRRYLLGAIRRGLRFSGSGWVMRDLVWEEQLGSQLQKPA
ncbi:DUF4388 domain-containing protein [Deinococcus sp. Leaf326]|jgi:hypothetical protein|uniref:DUF4388 domain-containing protein n=1 Tax=Deinococcus sp. Leaf326 TaxID=1736338 RepID=UPI0006F68D52|nr:DUF4388 domain-containing protein [Deinococcus sp. Leaf326]KQR41117.1 GTPase-activating protein [Deinococcus sp. Leaf326]